MLTINVYIDLYCWLFHRMDGPHSMLPARKVLPRLLSCYYKQELVWSWRQRWGGVMFKIVLVILSSAHIPQVPTFQPCTLLGVNACMGGIYCFLNYLICLQYIPMQGQHTEPLALFTDHYVPRFCRLQLKLMQVVSCHHSDGSLHLVSIANTDCLWYMTSDVVVWHSHWEYCVHIQNSNSLLS